MSGENPDFEEEDFSYLTMIDMKMTGGLPGNAVQLAKDFHLRYDE